MTEVLFVGPTQGNGGIFSWTKKFVKAYPNEEFTLFHESISYRRCKSTSMSLIPRIIDGLLDLRFAYNNAKRAIREYPNIKIFHTVTSGNMGSLRDYEIMKLCHKHGIKGIMHCRYGCIPEDISSKGLIGRLLRKAMKEYDQIWVLDKRSYNALNNIPYLTGKVFLTPNSIEVKEQIDETPKNYKHVAFIGNLVPTKGLFELAEAVTRFDDVVLDIIGPGEEPVLERLREISGDKLNKNIFIHGGLPNDKAVEFMKKVDIVALPTYFPWEGFPISIIEAMSLTKMVISCPRAAIPDMLTDIDGNRCGILVKEKSVDEIVDAINWCRNNNEAADKMCRKAYEKVYKEYRTDVIYELYRSNYRKLL